ncbi:MAG: hypothetical protein HY675_20495 [Chloroflexi bacterium]|nr:hypothetical protein [Chloroflexota bacterium]
MKVIADVKCYHCGFISGQLVGDDADPVKADVFRPAAGYSRPMPRAGEALRCGRCGGPVYLEDVRPYRERPVEPITTRRRRPWTRRQLAKAS